MRTARFVPLSLVLILGATASLSLAVVDTHLNEISEPVLDYANTRVPELDAKGTLTKIEKKERKQLAKLQKKLPKIALVLKNDFKELRLSTKGAKKMKDAAVGMRAALDDMFARAELALDERRDTIGDHIALLTDFKAVDRVQKQVGKAAAARTKADAAETDDVRAKFLVKAEKSLTRGLKKAEKALRGQGTPLPPIRLRSGDLVGQGGARVTFQGAADSPLTGAWVLFGPGALTQNTVITLSEAADFVVDPDVVAGPAMLIEPDGLLLTSSSATVNLPYEAAQGSDTESIGLFRETGGGSEGSLDVFRGGNGFMQAEIDQLGTYQAGQLAPPAGAPGGLFHLQMLGIFTRPGEGATPDPTLFTRVFDQDIRFKADGTGQALLGNQLALMRSFTRTTPHHTDLANTLPAGTYAFDWVSQAPGYFSYTFPFDTEQIAVEGVLSADGRVIALTGRGGNLEVFGVGVKGGTGVTAADLQGRWLTTSVSIELANPGAAPPTLFTTPFETAWTNSFGWFDADNTGALTYDPTGLAFESRVTYDTSIASPAHSIAHTAVAPPGSTTVNVGSNGRISDASFTRSGWIDPEAGVYLSSALDAAASTLSFEIAVRQPAGQGNDGMVGNARFVKLDIGAAVSAASTSAHDVLPASGHFNLPVMGTAQLDFEDAVRRTYSLDGPPPVTDLAWAFTPADLAVPSFSESLTQALDGSGNHIDPSDDRLFGVDASGAIVLGARRNGSGQQRLGLFVGFMDE